MLEDYPQRSNLRPFQQCCARDGNPTERQALVLQWTSWRSSGTVPVGRLEQIQVIFERIRTILAASNMTFEDIVKLTTSRTSQFCLTISASVRASWEITILRQRC